MEHYADRMESYTHSEPLPLSDFVIARARALAAFGRGGRSPDVFDGLRKLREQAVEASMLGPLAPIDAALSACKTSE